MPLLSELSDLRDRIQGELFPALAAEVGPLSERHRQFITVLDMVPVGSAGTWRPGDPGRPPEDRVALARALIAKAVFAIPDTRLLIERLRSDSTLRRLCGWHRFGEVPEEWTFSRAFAEFARSELPTRLHEALIRATHKERLVGHVSRDATAIEAREKPIKVKAKKRWRKRVHPRRGEEGWEDLPRLERQGAMRLAEMLAELPRHCAVGVKPNAKGRKEAWVGYKLHIDTADGGIPVSCLLTSASLHDSQAAIPLMHQTAGRITHLYELMDASYDAPEIEAAVRAEGRVPIIARQPRRGGKEEAVAETRARASIGFAPAEAVRYSERTTAERVNARLKDEFGGRFVRVRGAAKVMCHLMFGILALTVDQLMRLLD